MEYLEIPDAFPVDYRDGSPVAGHRACTCGHDEDEHDEDGICQIKRCDCDDFRADREVSRP